MIAQYSLLRRARDGASQMRTMVQAVSRHVVTASTSIEDQLQAADALAVAVSNISDWDATPCSALTKYADVIRCLRVLSHLDSPEIENLKTITKTFTNCCGMYEARAVQK